MLPRVIDRNLYLKDPFEYRRALSLALNHLREVSGYYPEFEQWLAERVVPGLILGERSILLSESRGVLSGLAVVKDTPAEQKLCCLRVLPPFQGSGVGLKLFDRAFDVLENRTPLLSVAEEQIAVFDKIFRYYGFELAATYPEFYRPTKNEYSFNGLLVGPDSRLGPNSTRGSLLIPEV
ncbi:GNAT family N-acetyltransferase [Cupriavidus taiwanensis]|uniref:GNAT family N-acetyltransferase n=1 Tax=Cupriavidus taiwanensis TaxID=164546 RepID=UPI001572E28F|nr:GNAT family N-acetyltransferase [Cupriavidus taiwanensis]NSX16165.1 GNAT family N-acetyltransferase [Cupriavidus taiwanensis]